MVADIEAMLTMDPPPLRIIACPSAWHDRKTPVRSTSMTCRHCSSGMLSAGAALAMPAALTPSVSGSPCRLDAGNGCGQGGRIGHVRGSRHCAAARDEDLRG